MKKIIALLTIVAMTLMTSCSKVETTSEFTYLEQRTLGDTSVVIYDVKGTQNGRAQVGDAIISFEIVDPVYYGKQSDNLIKQIQEMGIQVDLENQTNNLYAETDTGIGNATLYYSTEYINIGENQWVFLMNNYDENGVHNNALMGITNYKDRWVVMNVISAFDSQSENMEINKLFYKELIEAFNLTNCIAIDEVMNMRGELE